MLGHGRLKRAGAQLRELATFEQHADTGGGVLHALEASAHLKVDLASAEGTLQQFGACLVLEGHEVRQCLDNRDFGTERLPDAGELTADDAAAQDDDRAGNPI
jgi:hypothetical protein